ncbi:MAG: hypothetical protein ACJ75B_19240 [Flavisolibacter sp.]
MRKPFQQYMIKCIVCGETLITKRSHAKTCKKSTCRVILSREKLKKEEPIDYLRVADNNPSKKKVRNPKSHQNRRQINTGKKEFLSVEILEYCILGTPYGCLFRFFGYQGALFNTSSDWDLIKSFESHLVKNERYPSLAKPDKNKVAAFKLLLDNKRFIGKHVRCAAEGYYKYKGAISVKDGTIERPVYEYHVT